MRTKFRASCKHWTNHNWFDDYGVMRMGKCASPAAHLTAIQAETTTEDPVCWEANE